ncbi:cytochrome B5 [Whalleya microplaca]|nr:cytochrome B5 [Whalleya microplaca]
MAAETQEFTAKEVAAHRDAADSWMVIHGEVYDVTKYIHDHPGGADVLVEAAGSDASEAFDNAGHSEDAFEIMADYRVGKLKGYGKRATPKPIQLPISAVPKAQASMPSRGVVKALGVATVALGAVGLYCTSNLDGSRILAVLPQFLVHVPASLKMERSKNQGLGFSEGFIVASIVFGFVGSALSRKLMKMIHFDTTFMNYPPHLKLPKSIKPDVLRQSGWLHPSAYQNLPLIKKELVAPNTYRLVFELPTSQTILGLPIGQHVAIQAVIDGQAVTRSYTPVSNNADTGVLELVIKCYPDGLLTGRYLANLQIGDEVQFRGPKGAMRYKRGLCKKIGMIAGGTGITPMYQLIRAICEDDRDTTEVSLIYANRSEEDILLRKELETFARRYPANLKLFYLLDKPPTNWAYGSGYVTKDIMVERCPAPSPDSRIMLCGPPGMINAAKKGLADIGFQKPGATAKISDQVFCF